MKIEKIIKVTLQSSDADVFELSSYSDKISLAVDLIENYNVDIEGFIVEVYRFKQLMYSFCIEDFEERDYKFCLSLIQNL